MLINIKPLSVNQAWQGKRYKTPKYNEYISDVSLLLKPMPVPKGKIRLDVTFGMSSKLSDIDNPLKCFIDCLQKRYGFDDKMIYELRVKKQLVKKGCEFIDFELFDYAG